MAKELTPEHLAQLWGKPEGARVVRFGTVVKSGRPKTNTLSRSAYMKRWRKNHPGK